MQDLLLALALLADPPFLLQDKIEKEQRLRKPKVETWAAKTHTPQLCYIGK